MLGRDSKTQHKVVQCLHRATFKAAHHGPHGCWELTSCECAGWENKGFQIKPTPWAATCKKAFEHKCHSLREEIGCHGISPPDITEGRVFNVSFHIKGLLVTNTCSHSTLSCIVILSTSKLGIRNMGCVVSSFLITYWANCPQEAQFTLWFQCFEFGKSRIFCRESLPCPEAACDWERKFRLRKWHLLINTVIVF